MSGTGPWPAVDGRFARAVAERTPMRFEHRMGDHPLLTLDAVADLGERLGPESISAEAAAKPLITHDPSSRAVESISEQIREIAANDSWFTLLHVEREAAYRVLVDQIIDGVAHRADLAPEEMRHRMGFVFASSPGSVTSAHVDVENSLLMQLRGHRTLSFGAFADAEERETEVRRYWAGGFGRLARLPRTLEQHVLEPGVGAYIPPWCPHWITNGDELSLSMTVTFFTEESARETRVQAFNNGARRLGVTARPYGTAPVRDRAKAATMRAVTALKKLRDPDHSPFR